MSTPTTWTSTATPARSVKVRARPTTGEDAAWRLLSVKEVAAACRLSEKAVRRAIDDGELPALKLRSRLRVTPQDFASWIESNRRATVRPDSSPQPRKRRAHPAGTFRALLQDGTVRRARP